MRGGASDDDPAKPDTAAPGTAPYAAPETPVLVHGEAFADLDHASTVAAVAEGCVTAGGRAAVREILSSPVYSSALLRMRAGDIRGACGVARALRGAAAEVRADEEGAVWCSTPAESMDEDTSALLEEPYFRGLVAKPLNGLWPALWANNAYSMFAAPALALSAPLSYLLMPYFIIRFKLKLPLDFRTFVRLMYHSLKGAGAALNLAFGSAPSFAMQLVSVGMTCVMYFQAVVSSFRHSFRLVGVCQRVARRMNSLCRVLARCDELVDARCDGFYSRWVVGYRPSKNSGPPPVRTDEAIRPWKAGFARALRDFRLLDRAWIRHRLRQLFHLDAVCALRVAAARHALRPVTFLPRASEALLISDGRRLRDGDVANSFAAMRGANGVVLTGPNASGKSTVLRMIGCVVLMAQTTGLAPARACALHPIKYLTTMMGIRDDPEAGRSRFQNELLRAGECVESARRRPGDVGLLLMDEIFGGTDPVQGDVCGSKVLTSLAETTGCLYVLATHQKGLVEHSSTVAGTRRFRMSDNYKLVAGVNDSFNAAELFERAMPTPAAPPPR